MAFRESDIIFYRSGIVGDCLGGPMHSESVSPFQLHNIFNLVSSVEKMVGKTKYRCVYMKNKSLTETAINPKVYIPEDTVSSTTTLFVGFDPNSGLGDGTSSGITSPIPNESTAPVGVRFTQATDPSQGIALGFNIPPKMVVAVWFKLVIFLNTESTPVDGCNVMFRFGNLLPLSGVVGTDVILAITGETDSLQPFSRTIERIKLRSSLSSVVFTGNTTTSNDPTTWLNMLGALKSKVGIAFGPQDAKSATLKNQLITELDNTTNVKSSGYSYQIINNTYIIYLDVTQSFINPSPQFDFIKAQLLQARSTAGIDFIIVVCNKAFYATLAPNDTSLAIDNTLRTTYHQLFVDNGVHLVISGQTRNYQRHHVLGYNSASPDNPTVFFANHNSGYLIPNGQKNFGATGCLFLNIGTGGMRPLHNLATKKPYTLFADSLQNQESVGYLMLKCTKKTTTRGPTMLGLFFEYYTPTGTTTPIETQRDTFAVTILTSGTAPVPSEPAPAPTPSGGTVDKWGVKSTYATGPIKYNYVENFRSDGLRFDYEGLGSSTFVSSEIIGYFAHDNPPSDEVSGKLGGGEHSSGSRPQCYDIGIDCRTGASRYRTEDYHPNYSSSVSGGRGSPLKSTFVGYKFIKRNLTNPNRILLELWQDTGNNQGSTPANQWVRISSWIVTSPYWPTPGTDHQETIRIDEVSKNDLKWKWLSLRQIETGDPTTP